MFIVDFMGIKKLLTGAVITWGLNSMFKTPVEKNKPKNGWYLNFSNDLSGDVYVDATHYTDDIQKIRANLSLSHIWREFEKTKFRNSN